MQQARLIRVVRFRATHRYGKPEWSAERNRTLFGAQTEPHAHDWRVEVHVRGPVDPDTGWSTDLGPLDASIDAALEGWDGGDLNRVVPEVADGGGMPSTENLARWLYLRLAPTVEAPAVLVEVRVWESDALGAAYPG